MSPPYYLQSDQIHSVQDLESSSGIPDEFDAIHLAGEGLEHLLHGGQDPVRADHGIPEQLDVGHPVALKIQSLSDGIQIFCGHHSSHRRCVLQNSQGPYLDGDDFGACQGSFVAFDGGCFHGAKGDVAINGPGYDAEAGSEALDPAKPCPGGFVNSCNGVDHKKCLPDVYFGLSIADFEGVYKVKRGGSATSAEPPLTSTLGFWKHKKL